LCHGWEGEEIKELGLISPKKPTSRTPKPESLGVQGKAPASIVTIRSSGHHHLLRNEENMSEIKSH
jgi:hypothetical protein